MKVRFWGTRGSIPKPGPKTLRHGGNTSCVEVRSLAGTLLVIDCGSGAHDLGQALISGEEQPVRGSLLISHTHWDHIQGVPFFTPLFVPGNEWDVYAPHGLSQSLRDTLAGQMQYKYFPITLDAMGANIRYHDLVEGEFFAGDVKIHTHYLNHPAITLGYRIEADGVCVVYACDHEPISRVAVPDAADLAGRERAHIEFLRNADLVIHDAQYTAAEYSEKIGWGHSSVEYAAEVCHAANVKRLVFTHHDPERDDESLDQIVSEVRAKVEAADRSLEISAAAEGQVIEFERSLTQSRSDRSSSFDSTTAISEAVSSHFVAFGSIRHDAHAVIRSAAEAEELTLVSVGLDEKIPDMWNGRALALIIVDAEEAPRQLAALKDARARDVAVADAHAPILVVSEDDHEPSEIADLGADWLLWPFSEQFARTKIRASVLRAKCRWIRAKTPHDEAQRLAELDSLGILDTDRDERFDRFTRIVSNAFGVPIALVSIVDRDRQWFKSCIGLDTRETSRELAFCAHAILEPEPLVVPDTLVDQRFADNPLVTHHPRIRFYAGCPIRSPGGQPLGTLCLIDTQPRSFDKQQIALLTDLAALVEKEISVYEDNVR